MELSELELNNIGEWPPIAKAVLIAMGSALVGFGWYYFVTNDQLDRLERTQQKESELRQGFEQKQRKAANLDGYRAQLVEMEESFGTLLRQLPDQTEVASLLVDVSQTGLAAGLEFELFQPAGETNKDFYAELPIRVRVAGRYHQFATFVSGLAALPRIVTVHNIEIGRNQGRGAAAGPMLLSATVKTYRYLDEPGVR